MERKVGEIFDYNGVKLRVGDEFYCCEKCYFAFHDTCNSHTFSITGECSQSIRPENKDDVVFIKVK